MSYTNVFSDNELPPSDASLAVYNITANTTLTWPSYVSQDALPLASIVEFSSTDAFTLTLPPADQVSVGESVLVLNTGAYALDFTDVLGGAVLSLAAGAAYLLYVKDNSSSTGAWQSLAYSVGSSTASAAALAGNGLQSLSAKLALEVSSVVLNSDFTALDTHRAQLLLFTGGATTLTLTAISSLGENFYCHVKNNGTGTVTVQPSGGNVIDGAATLTIQPAESCAIMSDGANAWVTVGLGRSTVYQYSNLTLDVSAGGSFTLTSAQAANKLLTFVGNPAAGVSVVVPGIVSIYYVANNLSTAQSVQVKTASVEGTSVAQSQRVVVLCDGVSVTSAQTAPTTSIQSLLDGTVKAPSLNFATKTDTGLYKFSTQGLGLTVNGVAQLTTNGTGVALPAGLTDSLNFLTTGARITGDFSNATLANRVMFQTSTVNGQTSIGVLPNGTSSSAELNLFGGNDPTNAAIAQLLNAGGEVSFKATISGTGTYPPMMFYTGGAERVRIGTAGQLGIGGANYGTAGQVLMSGGPSAAPSWAASIIQAGAVSYFAMATAPSGWLKANGALISRTTYAALFAVVGTKFGAGDGSTTFALPDLRGEFLRSLDDGRGVDSGRTLGSAQSGDIQSHTHPIHSLAGANWSGANGYNVGYGQGDAGWVTDKIRSTGGTETRPRNVALLACIKF